MTFTDAHVLITGGSDGIGLALARQLDASGARLTLCGRDEARLARARAELGGRCHVVTCDLSKPDDRHRLLREARAANGPLDALVNNAGVQQLMDFTRDGEPRHITHEIEVNLTAPVLLTEAALPELRERPRATLVFVTSGLALSPKASAPVYCATKAALRSFTRSLRWQLEGSRVRVVEVLPPIVDTAMTRGRGAHKLTPDEVARDVVRGLAQGDDELFIGRTKLLRLVMALSPRLAGASTRRM